MGFDLWGALGVSPQTGLMAVAGALALAALLGGWTFLRNRSDSHASRGLSLDD
jgi:hypothetical protein